MQSQPYISLDQIPPAVIDILFTLKSQDKQAFLVGGCVRDMLLGLVPRDFDIATSATHKDLLHIFPHSDKVGAHFGVVIQDGVEIASFRSDGAYSDHRRPDAVQTVTDPYEDSCRRDFTINAMMFDPFEQRLLDFHMGAYDLVMGVIRAVGDPNVRFGQEDYLRMLRAVRFSSRFNFGIEDGTMKAIRQHASGVKLLATERVRDELISMFSSPNSDAALRALLRCHLLEQVIPELLDLPQRDLGITLRVLSTRQENVPEFDHALAMARVLFKLKPVAVRYVVSRLKFSSDDQAAIYQTIQLQNEITGASEQDEPAKIKRLIRQGNFHRAMRLYQARTVVIDPSVSAAPFFLMMRHSACYSEEALSPSRLLNGYDLIGMGMTPDLRFKEILFQLETAQLNGDVKTRSEAEALVSSLMRTAA